MSDPSAKHITPDLVRQVAKLSRLAPDEASLPKLAAQLESILGYVAKVGEAKFEGVEPMAHAIPLQNVFRSDEPGPTLRVDQVAEYATSVHGRRLRELADPKVATCVSCHPAHNIRPPSDPKSSVYPLHVADTCGRCHSDAKYMASYKIPTDQVAKYKTSVHWKAMTAKGDLSAPT